MNNLEQMRQRAAEILASDDEHLTLIRYGAAYCLALMGLVEFYLVTERIDEAKDVILDLKTKLAASNSRETIAKNLLRIGLCWDEFEKLQLTRTSAPQMDWADLLAFIREVPK